MRFEYDHTNLDDQRFMLVYGTFKIRRTLDITDTTDITYTTDITDTRHVKRNICVTIPYS